MQYAAWMSRALLRSACSALLFAACGGPGSPEDAGGADAGAGMALDAAGSLDAGVTRGWREEAPTPVAIQEIAVAAHEGRVWIAGGIDGLGTIVTTVRVYDPVAREWSLGPSLPEPRHHMHLVSHRGDLYALGGMQTLAFEPLSTAWALRAGADAWEPIASLLQSRGSGAAAAAGDVIVVAGGDDASGRRAVDTLVYDPAANTWRTAAPIPTPREHLAAVEFGGELYVLAGRRGGLDTARTELEIYDPASDTWRTGPELPYPRGGFGAAVLAGSIFVIGGEESTRVLDTVDRFDLATETWSASPPTLSPHHGHGAATVGDRIYIVAGADRPAFGAFDAVESYAP